MNTAVLDRLLCANVQYLVTSIEVYTCLLYEKLQQRGGGRVIVLQKKREMVKVRYTPVFFGHLGAYAYGKHARGRAGACPRLPRITHDALATLAAHAEHAHHLFVFSGELLGLTGPRRKRGQNIPPF